MASSYQTLSDVFSDVRYLSNKDSNTLVDSDLLRIANKYYLLMVRELVSLNEDFYAEISRTDLVAGQREYPLPVDNATGTGSDPYGGGLIKLQRVEISYENNLWRVADPISFQQVAGATVLDADIASQFDRSDPRYTFKDRSVWIFPIPTSSDDVATGNENLYIYWIKRKKELSATTDIPDIPKDFLNVLVEGMLHDIYRKYGRNRDSEQSLRNWNQFILQMKDLDQHPDLEQPFILKRMRQNYK